VTSVTSSNLSLSPKLKPAYTRAQLLGHRDASTARVLDVPSTKGEVLLSARRLTVLSLRLQWYSLCEDLVTSGSEVVYTKIFCEKDAC
jgi:hypothetical protein